MANSSLVNQLKREAGVIVEELCSSYPASPIISCEGAALRILSGRKTKAVDASVLTGLVVGSLCSKGAEGEEAAEILIHRLSNFRRV